MRRVAVALALMLAIAVPAGTSRAAEPPAPRGKGAVPAPRPGFLEIRVDGKVFRKSSGKLVFSLSSFEIGSEKSVTLENRKTKKKKRVALSSVYDDMSYSEPLPEDEYEAFVPADWIPFVVWKIEDTNEALNRKLTGLHEEQNNLRRQLGLALVEEDGEEEGKVTSRVTLNKIEKYHHLATIVARRILKTWNREETNPFLFPVRIQIAFNPFGNRSGLASNGLPLFQGPVQQVREVMYWEVYRVLSQQYEVSDAQIDLAYNSPPTIRQIVPLGVRPVEGGGDFVPTVFLSGETLDGVVYIERQGFQAEVKDLLRTKQFLSRFVTDRPVLDALFNEGRVSGIEERRLDVSFIPPFMKVGEKVWVALSDEEEVPVTLVEPFPDEGYTRTSELPADVLARVKPGMTVRRKK
jgi:hypothetical protein